MKILGLDHIQFIVKDLGETIEFFKNLGFVLEKQTEHHGGSAEFRISPGGTVLEIHISGVNENPGHDHFAISVEDIDAAAKELRDKGVDVSEPRLIKVTGRRISDFRDNDGFRWQLVGPKEE